MPLPKDIGVEKRQINKPQDDWESQTWYIVDVAFNKNNPIHRSLFYSGFLNGIDPQGNACNSPGGYNKVVAGSYNGIPIHDVYYMKIVKKIGNIEEL